MAILQQNPNIPNGDSVDAQIISDTIDTAIDARQRSVSAEIKSSTAEQNSAIARQEAAEAKIFANNAFVTSNQANLTSEDALEQARTANAVSWEARDVALSVREDADNGVFNGEPGPQGPQGEDGSDGRSTWIKYNTFPQDAGATITWSEGQNYIGIQSVVATTHPTTGYTWSKFIHEAEKQLRSATVIVGFTDDCDFNITKLGTLNNAQATINNALLTLPTAGGKVILREGTYNITGSIIIRRPYVTIEGVGISTELKRMANFTQGIFRFQYANNKLEKCYINGNGMQGSGIEVLTDSNIITGNICKNNNIAINVPGSNNTITGNICDENSFISILNVGNENAITNNVCRAGSIGIHIEQGGAITISSNTCIGNIRGIVIEEGLTHITVTANTCIYCEQAGINTLGSQITITGNTCSSSNVGILLENGEVNTITGNCCCENNDCGIRLYNCSNNTITGNNCGQSYIGIEIGGYASYYNLIVGNTLYCTVPYSDYGHGTWIRINKNGSANIGA